jgi:hypothetical protein
MFPQRDEENLSWWTDCIAFVSKLSFDVMFGLKLSKLFSVLEVLTLNMPTTTIVAQPFNVIKWQLNFNPVG